MMKPSLFIIAVFFFSIVTFGQRENHTWYFSNTNKGLFFDYTTNNISITSAHSPMIEAGSYFVACDNVTGQLLFYTDGTNIWDSNNQIMPNGSSLTNAPHAMQTGLACYYPGHPNQFLLFCNTSAVPSSGSVYYSVIDMSLAGNGTVVNPKGNIVSGSKNIYLTNQCSEGMYIIKGSGNFYWLIVPKLNTTNISVYKIDASGVNLTNTINVGLNVGLCVDIRYSYVSHKLGIANMKDNGPSFILDFNELTGILSNAIQIPGITTTSTNICNATDMEWSPNGQYLYFTKYRDCTASSPGKLFQYNTLVPATPPVLIAQVALSGTNASMGLKLGPDGKIYHRYISSSNTYFGIINSPDLQGIACNYNPTGFNIGSSMGNMHKFPEFLVPLDCEFSSTNTLITTDFVCRPNDTTHIDIPLLNFADNPCSDSLTYQVLEVSSGSANIVGNNVQYVQPNYYIVEDTIVLTVCNNSGLCDTTMAFIHLNYVGPVTPVITVVNDTLFSSASADNQWILNGTPIPGATGSFYVPTQSGYYSIKINVGLCYAESAPFYFEYQSINENVNSTEITIYPNPAKNVLTISGIKDCEIKIYDATGRLLMATKNEGTLPIANLESGIYFISIKNGYGNRILQFVKE